jgi:hypothetical protein
MNGPPLAAHRRLQQLPQHQVSGAQRDLPGA